MNLKESRWSTSGTERKELTFFQKIKGALLLSGHSFSQSYRSTKLWQGHVMGLSCIVLLAFVLSTSTFPLFMEYFSHIVFLITILGVSIWISFSPVLFLLVILAIGGFWIVLCLIMSYFKKLESKRTLSALGFAFSPLLVLIFYILNKFILQSFKYELGPFLISIGLVWSVISGFIGLANLIGFDFGGLFNYSFKSIVFRKKRTYAAIIGIAVAVGLITTPIPIISGYYTQLSGLAQQFQYSQYLIGIENGKLNYYDSYIENTTLQSLNHSNIEIISPETYLNVNLSLNDNIQEVNLRGINYTIFQNFRNSLSFQILPSETFSENRILIGCFLASLLNLSYADLPFDVNLTYYSKSCSVTIIGLFSSNIQYDTELLVPFNITWFLKPGFQGRYSLVEIKLEDPTLVESTIQDLQLSHPELEIKSENQLTDFVAGIISRTIESIWFLSVVVYIVMAFGMYHTIQTTITESKGEIAILKTIGASKFQLIRIFLYQTFLLCIIGGTLGIVSGVFLSYVASFLVSSITTITVQPIFDVLTISIAILLSLTSCLVGSLYPTIKASKMVVGEIIR